MENSRGKYLELPDFKALLDPTIILTMAKPFIFEFSLCKIGQLFGDNWFHRSAPHRYDNEKSKRPNVLGRCVRGVQNPRPEK